MLSEFTVAPYCVSLGRENQDPGCLSWVGWCHAEHLLGIWPPWQRRLVGPWLPPGAQRALGTCLELPAI